MSYFESRGGKFDNVVFFGLQYILKKWLTEPITRSMIEEAKELFKDHFPDNQDIFNAKGWEHILEHHNGYLPLSIKAVPEGTRVPVKNVLFTVESTDPEVAWLTNYVESLLDQCWYPMTVCTQSFEQKLILKKFMTETCDDLAGLDSKLTDFGFRGCSSAESGGIGGCSHLACFTGSDTLQAILVAKKYYNAKSMPAFTIPAAEHSTITTWGPGQGEHDVVRHILDQVPTGPVSIVADSYDLWNFIDNVVGGQDLKEIIKDRQGVFVLRPDSGDPSETLLKTLTKLSDVFPPTRNSKGYKVLPKFIRVIQGDGISIESLQQICHDLQKAQFSLDNVVFGSGGALLQKLNRDTQRCAYKCCLAIIDGNTVINFNYLF